MTNLLKRTKLGLTLWTAFGLLIALGVGQALIVDSRLAAAKQAGAEATTTACRPKSRWIAASPVSSSSSASGPKA